MKVATISRDDAYLSIRLVSQLCDVTTPPPSPHSTPSPVININFPRGNNPRLSPNKVFRHVIVLPVSKS